MKWSQHLDTILHRFKTTLETSNLFYTLAHNQSAVFDVDFCIEQKRNTLFSLAQFETQVIFIVSNVNCIIKLDHMTIVCVIDMKIRRTFSSLWTDDNWNLSFSFEWEYNLSEQFVDFDRINKYKAKRKPSLKRCVIFRCEFHTIHAPIVLYCFNFRNICNLSP